MTSSSTSRLTDQTSATISSEVHIVARFVRSRGTLLKLDAGNPTGTTIAQGIVAAAHDHDTMEELEAAVQDGKPLLDWDNRDVHYQLEDVHHIAPGKSAELAADITDAVHPDSATLNHLRKRIAASPEQADLRVADLLNMTGDQHDQIALALKLPGHVQVGDIARSGARLNPDILHHLLIALLAPGALPEYPIDQDLVRKRLAYLRREAGILSDMLTEAGITIAPEDAAYFTAAAHGATSLASAEHAIQLGNDVGDWKSGAIFSHVNQSPGVKGTIAQEDLSEIIDRIENAIAPERPTITRLRLEIAANPGLTEKAIISVLNEADFKNVKTPLEKASISTIGDFARHGHEIHPFTKRATLQALGRSLPGHVIPEQ